MGKNLVPINRANKFFSGDDFDLEQSFGMEYVENDLHMTFVLYRVDAQTTESDDVYNEAPKGGIKFKLPIEISGIIKLDSPENKAYNSGSGSLRYLQDGLLTVILYSKQLKRLNVEISYGDYIGYAVSETEMRYFVVTNDGKKNYDNAHTIIGYKGAFRTIKCAPADPNEFNAE